MPDQSLRFRTGRPWLGGPGQDPAIERLGVPEDRERTIEGRSGVTQQTAHVYGPRQVFGGYLVVDESGMIEPILFRAQITLVAQIGDGRDRDDLVHGDSRGLQAVNLARVV